MNSEKVICRKISDGVLIGVPGTFDIGQIAASGQCFRLVSIPTGGFVALTGNYLVEIEPHKDGYIFHCSFEEFRDVWLWYFDLVVDYGSYQQKMNDDPFLQAAIVSGGGIRILRQDLWETVVTFIISQRNNIPRIAKSVDALCREYGSPLGKIGDQVFYSFPTPVQLRGKDLSVASLGYREEYVKGVSIYDEGFWRELTVQDDATAWKTLLGIKGVGEKVASCIMLFGLHRMDSYPRDVWINRMIEEVYHGEFDPTKYAGFAGYVQQLQFYHYRNISKESNESEC